MFESIRILSINSHSEVLRLTMSEPNLSSALSQLQSSMIDKEISFPQLLAMEDDRALGKKTFYLAGPKETLTAIEREFPSLVVSEDHAASVTLTCSGVATPEIAALIARALAKANITPLRLWMSGMSCTILLTANFRELAITSLHSLIED